MDKMLMGEIKVALAIGLWYARRATPNKFVPGREKRDIQKIEGVFRAIRQYEQENNRDHGNEWIGTERK